MRFDIRTKASPEQVLRALTDFTDARLQIWNRTLDPKTYELRDSGETWAVARESTARSPFWVVVRYDWSDAETIRWIVLDSSYGGGGEGLVQIARGVDGGSQVHAEWTYTGPPPDAAATHLPDQSRDGQIHLADVGLRTRPVRGKQFKIGVSAAS